MTASLHLLLYVILTEYHMSTTAASICHFLILFWIEENGENLYRCLFASSAFTVP